VYEEERQSKKQRAMKRENKVKERPLAAV